MNKNRNLRKAESFKELEIFFDRTELLLFFSYKYDLSKSQVLEKIDTLVINKSTKKELKKYFIKKIPLAYIFGYSYFYEKKFYINRGVLIPRNETEILVDFFIKLEKKYNIEKVLEIGTGSGCIPVTLSRLFPEKNFTSTDISKKALRIAKKNNFTERIKFKKTNFLNRVENDFDILISNPPYIAKDYKLDPYTKKEPKKALFSKNQGYYFYIEFIKYIKKLDGKIYLFEIGFDQKETIEKMLLENEIKEFEFYKDYSSNYRILYIRK